LGSAVRENDRTTEMHVFQMKNLFEEYTF
jgi:hypothetical protein